MSERVERIQNAMMYLHKKDPVRYKYKNTFIYNTSGFAVELFDRVENKILTAIHYEGGNILEPKGGF